LVWLFLNKLNFRENNYKNDTKMIKLIDSFLTDSECQEYIKLIDEKSLQTDLPSFNNLLDNFNAKYIDSELCSKFYNRFIQLNKDKIASLSGCNNIITMAKYNKGQSFGLHTDTGLYYDKTNRIKSNYTVLIYLNDDFKGGNTVFYINNESITIKPKKGTLLIFDISLFHQGCEVEDGTKYWIGCEFIGPF